MQPFTSYIERFSQSFTICRYLEPLLNWIVNDSTRSLFYISHANIGPSIFHSILYRLRVLGFEVEKDQEEENGWAIKPKEEGEEWRVKKAWMNQFTMHFCKEMGRVLHCMIHAERKGTCQYLYRGEKPLFIAILSELRKMIRKVEVERDLITLYWW